jgi:hypothetical protein
MFLRTAIDEIFVLRRGRVHLLYVNRSSNNTGAMPHISIDLRQLQILVRRSCTSRELSWHTHFVSPLLQIHEPSTSSTGKDTVVRFSHQLHITLLFLNSPITFLRFSFTFGLLFEETPKDSEDRPFRRVSSFPVSSVMDSILPFWEYVGATELALEPSCREFGRSVDDFTLFRKDDDKGGKVGKYPGKLALHFYL